MRFVSIKSIKFISMLNMSRIVKNLKKKVRIKIRGEVKVINLTKLYFQMNNILIRSNCLNKIRDMAEQIWVKQISREKLGRPKVLL